MVNGMIPQNGKNGFMQPGQPVDPVIQQRLLQARAQAIAQAQQAAVHQLPSGMIEQQMNGEQANGGVTAEHLELARLAQQAGFGGNLQAFLEARSKARLLSIAKMTAAQQQQALGQQGQANGNVPNGNGTGDGNGNGTPQSPFASPAMLNGQLQLKFPAHAAARLGAAQQQQRV